jgi:ketosteroid isomerase-like protein
MALNLPPAVRTFVDATNAGDSDAFVAAFTPDAVLDDWGRTFAGHDGIARWNVTDNIGKRSHFEPVSAEETGTPGVWTVVLTVTGDGYNGTGPLTFTLDGDRIARLVISPT